MFVTCVVIAGCKASTMPVDESRSLQFSRGDDGSFRFDTGVLKGELRGEGRSIGLLPVTYMNGDVELSSGEGLFNHYRVFTRGKRYGYGARRWPSTADLHHDGSVEVTWPVTEDRPFELRTTYRWVASNTLDLDTTVLAADRLEAFEVFLASYYPAGFTDSLVWATRDPRGGEQVGFVSADRELGEWQAFPRDPQAAAVIEDGRWDLEPHPLDWTLMPDFALPLAIRRDKATGLTVIVMSRNEDCFGIFTPYGEEEHFSNYLSLFGNNIEKGMSVSALSRLVVLKDPSIEEILAQASAFLERESR